MARHSCLILIIELKTAIRGLKTGQEQAFGFGVGLSPFHDL
jgi:hypothetical protein